LSTGGILWGHGPTALNLIDQVRMKGGVDDPVLRHRVVDVWIEHQILELIRTRTLVARLRGEQPGPEASIRKILADEHGQHVAALAVDLMGTGGVLAPEVDIDHTVWTGSFLFSQALTIGGGTGEVQRNIVGERVLQLPHEPGIV
jgi:alkylation response protein AidB-like acyl-CoA dehydrogenase